MQLFTADWIHYQGTFREEHALLVDDQGLIVAAGPAEEVRAHPDASGAELIELPQRAISPGTVSAHSHCFQVFLRGAGDHPLSFQDWVKRFLYPLIEGLDDASLEAAALLCFSQMARAGITTIGEFHYLHNDREDYSPRNEDLARIVIRAARQVGLRVGFLRAIYDVQERIGQGRMAQEIDVALSGIRALHGEYADDPLVTVMPAPHSLHGATQEAVEAGAALAKELGTKWHIHLAEQQADVGYCKRIHQGTPLEVLARWGVLDEQAVVVHGIWLNEQERELLAERGAALVSNPTTNMALGDGIAPLTDLIRRGIPVALGTDMNAGPCIYSEMRAAELLQRVQNLKMGCIPRSDDGTPAPDRIFDLGTKNGGVALGMKVGLLEPGYWADFAVVDLEDPSVLPGSTLGGDALLNTLTSSMSPERAIRGLYVAGKRIGADGELMGVDYQDLAERVRACTVLKQMVR